MSYFICSCSFTFFAKSMSCPIAHKFFTTHYTCSFFPLKWYRWPELNRHSLNGKRILSPSCLPIPPHRRHHLCIIFATIKKQVIKLTNMIKVLKKRLICASFKDNMGISGSSSSVLPILWSTVRHQISQSFLNIKTVLEY